MSPTKSGFVRPRIVVGYDGSEAARGAVSWPADQARLRGKVYVVHCLGDGLTSAGSLDHRDRGKAALNALRLEDGNVLIDVHYQLDIVDGRPAAAHP